MEASRLRQFATKVRSRIGPVGVAAACLIAIQVTLAVDSLRQQSVTLDEFAHLPAGISYWQKGRFFLYHHNPPLIKMLAAIPAVMLNPVMPYDSDYGFVPGDRPEVRFGRKFLEANRQRYFAYFMASRPVIVALAAFAGFLVFRWARELFGGPAALLSLSLWCFCPTVLAHSQFVTADIGATAAGLASAYAFRKYLLRPSRLGACLVGILLGAAVLSKFTLLVLYPTYLALAAFRWAGWLRRGPDEPAYPDRGFVGQCLFIPAVSLLVINAGYGFEGSFQRLGDYDFRCAALTKAVPPTPEWPFGRVNRFRDTWAAPLPVPVPRHFLTGLDAQKLDNDIALLNFLAGEHRQGGWWYYYVYALGIRVPLGTLLIGGLAAALACFGGGRYRASLLDEAILVLPIIAVFGLINSQTGVQDSRYLLPAFPFAVISFGRAAHWAVGRRWWRLAIILGLLAWSVVGTLRCHPHELSYYNEVVGGPERGHLHLSETLHWGQDLIALKRWIDDHPGMGRLNAACIGPVDPLVLGINYRLPPFWEADEGRSPSESLPSDDRPECYAISTFLLQGYDWDGLADGSGVGGVGVPWGAYRYFSSLDPVAHAGYSINIYRIRSYAVMKERTAVWRCKPGSLPG